MPTDPTPDRPLTSIRQALMDLVSSIERTLPDMVDRAVRLGTNDPMAQEYLAARRVLDESVQPAPPAGRPPKIVGEHWEYVDVGHGVLYGRCPSCGCARIAEWCPPPCNTQSARYARGMRIGVPDRQAEVATRELCDLAEQIDAEKRYGRS